MTQELTQLNATYKNGLVTKRTFRQGEEITIHSPGKTGIVRIDVFPTNTPIVGVDSEYKRPKEAEL